MGLGQRQPGVGFGRTTGLHVDPEALLRKSSPSLSEQVRGGLQGHPQGLGGVSGHSGDTHWCTPALHSDQRVLVVDQQGSPVNVTLDVSDYWADGKKGGREVRLLD